MPAVLEDAGARHKKENVISAAQLMHLLQHPPAEHAVKVIDASWYTPDDNDKQGADGSTALQDYIRERIPGAIFFDHDQVADFNSPLPQATPTADRFAVCMGALGISRDDHVVVYEGCGGFESAPRAWFLFKLFGHANVKVLEGGLPAWIEEGGQLEKGSPGSHPSSTTYIGAAEVPGMQIDVSQVVENLRLQRVQVVDCRQPVYYLGEKKEALYNVVNSSTVQYYDHREGHIPGAKNVPFDGLIQQMRKNVSSGNLAGMSSRSSVGGSTISNRRASRVVLPAVSMDDVFRRAQIDLRQSMALVCATGRTSAAMLLLLLNVGADAMLVKDGMAAWSTARGKSLPMSSPRKRSVRSMDVAEESDDERNDTPTGGEPSEVDRPKRVIMWAATRSRSTAFERAVSMRRDAVAMHELLTEPYLRQYRPENYKKLQIGQEQQRIATSAVTYQAIQEVMLADYSLQGRAFFFSKELACYYHPEEISDEWLLEFKHIILIREPKASLESFYRVSQNKAPGTYFDSQEAGFRECFEIYSRVTAAGGDVMVMDSDAELMANPEAALSRFCAFAGVEFDPGMLSWTPQELPDWTKFRGWHDDVSATSGFVPIPHPPSELPPEVAQEAEICDPYYYAVKWQTSLAREQWPLLAETAGADVSILCICSDKDLLIKLLAAKLAKGGLASFVLDPMELESAQQQFGFIFDGPLVIACAAEMAPQVAKELQPSRLRGEVCILRLIAVAEDLASEADPHLAHLGLPVTVVLRSDILCKYDSGSTNSDASLHYLKSIHSVIEQDLVSARAETQAALDIYIKETGLRSEPVQSWRSMFRASLKENPSAPAVIDEDVTFTLRDVHERASIIAQVLRERGAAKGTVCIYMERSGACCLAAVGALMVHTTFVDLAAWNKPNDLVRIIGVVEPNLVLTTKALAPNLEIARKEVHLPDIVLVEDLPEPNSTTQLESLEDTPEDDPERTAFSVLTSGSTSVSKVVLCPQAALTDALPYFRASLHDGDRVGVFWIYYYFICPILMKCTTVIIPDKAFLDPKLLLDCIKRQRLAAIYVTPSILDLCVKNSTTEEFSDAFSQMRVIWLTGEKLRDATREAVLERVPHVKVLNVYSTNESGDLAIAHAGGGVTQLLPYIQPKVINSQGNIVPRGSVGALHVLAVACFNGYLTTGGKVVRERHEFYNTGDLVRWLGDGKLTFVARQSGAHIKVRGYKVFPYLIEGVLSSHPSIGYAWVAGIGSTDENTQLEAALFVKPDAPPIQDEIGLREWLQKRLPHYMIPLRFHRLAEPPINMTGKAKSNPAAKFAELPPLCAAKEEIEPLTPALEQMATIWRKTLQLPLPGLQAKSNFFDFGGSLQFVKLAATIKEELNVTIPLAALLKQPTLAGVSETLAAENESTAEAEFDAQKEADKFPLKEGRPPVQTAFEVLAAARGKSTKSVLVTGSTGWLGAFVVKRLAKDSHVNQVYCVIRAKDSAAAKARLLATLKKRDLLRGDTSWLDRVVCYPGDVSETELGLLPSDLLLLIGQTDVVVHCGAEVNMIKPYSVLARSNVGGTANVLDFAVRASAPHIFTSTILPMEGEQITGYRRSKEVSEVLCLRAKESHAVPTAVLQLGDIGISSEPGAAVPDDDFLVILLRACMHLNLFPDADWAVSVISVDQCCDKIARLALQNPESAFTAIPEEVKGRLIAWKELFLWVGDELGLRMVSHAGWENAIRASAADGDPEMQRMLMLLPAISDESHAEAQRMHAGEGLDVEFAVDREWGLNLARSLNKERKQLAMEADAKASDKKDATALEKTTSWVALTSSEQLVPLQTILAPLGEHQVDIRVTHTGLTAADLNMIDGRFGAAETRFPHVAGGQLVGTVVRTGSAVNKIKPGDRVGLGWLKGACLECRHCYAGKEHLCSAAVFTCSGGQRGGLSERYHADARFVHAIPEKMRSAEAAPLLACGLTAFVALQLAQPGDAVGVIGIGAVGHLALQIAAKRGCVVTAISSSAKEMSSKELGADHFLKLADVRSSEAGSLDFILVASTNHVDPSVISHLLAPEGTVCFVMGGAASAAKLDLHDMALRGQRVTTAASGGRRDMQAFIQFVKAHGIKPRVETTSINGVNGAIAKMRANEARFCVVIEW